MTELTNKCAFCNNSILRKEEPNLKIYGKYVCNSKVCLDKANAELQAATDAAMSPRDMAISYLSREGFKEQNMTKGFFVLGDGVTQMAVNMNKLSDEFPGAPVIGVYAGGNIIESGHGVNRLDSTIITHRQNIIGIMKSKPSQKAKEQYASNSGGAIGYDEMDARNEQIKEPKQLEPKPQPKPAEDVKPKGDEKMETRREEKGLVTQEKSKLLAKAKLSDHELDEKIEREKARKYARGQGDFYKVQGKERPDAAMIQKLANESGISAEITKAEQTDKYAHVEVMGIFGNLRVPAVVHHDFDTEFMLKTMEIIKKNPEILDHYEGTNPVVKEGATIRQGDDDVDARYYLVHTLLSFKKFSLRDACTKAMSIVELKLLNQEFRDEEEIKSEQAEKELIEQRKARA